MTKGSIQEVDITIINVYVSFQVGVTLLGSL